MSKQFIVIESVPGYYNDTFSKVIGKAVLAEKEAVISGWKVPVKVDFDTNPDSIWTKDDITSLYLNASNARPATIEEIAEFYSRLTGSTVRATSRDNPFRHWNRIKGNHTLGMPEVYTIPELRA